MAVDTTSTPTNNPVPTPTATPEPTKTPAPTPTATTGPNIVQEIRGQVIEVVERNQLEIGLLRVLDENGIEWDFTTEGWVGIDASHLMIHQRLKAPVLVLYVDRGEALVALKVLD